MAGLSGRWPRATDWGPDNGGMLAGCVKMGGRGEYWTVETG